jgi:hypothetical protein
MDPTSVVISTVLRDLEDGGEDDEGANSIGHSGRLREAPTGWVNLLEQLPNHDPSLDRAFSSRSPEEAVKARRVVGALVGHLQSSQERGLRSLLGKTSLRGTHRPTLAKCLPWVLSKPSRRKIGKPIVGLWIGSRKPISMTGRSSRCI